jgi:hypothetical protein
MCSLKIRIKINNTNKIQINLTNFKIYKILTIFKAIIRDLHKILHKTIRANKEISDIINSNL